MKGIIAYAAGSVKPFCVNRDGSFSQELRDHIRIADLYHVIMISSSLQVTVIFLVLYIDAAEYHDPAVKYKQMV